MRTAAAALLTLALAAPGLGQEILLPGLAGAEPLLAAKITAAARRAEGDPGSAHAWGVLGMSLDVHGFNHEALAAYARAAELDPSDFRWAYYRALILAEAADPEALADFARARSAAPDYLPLLVRYGEALLAAEAELRDGREAVRLARGVCEATGYRSPEALDVLAAAEAESGDFEAAVATAGAAAELARAAGQEELARKIEERLQGYRAGQPYRSED